MAKHLAIVGTGISGLATAFWILRQPDIQLESLTFFEYSSTIGGALQSVGHERGYICEQGAQGVLATREIFSTLLQELQIAPITSLKFSRARFLITPKNTLEKVSPFKMLRYVKEYFFKHKYPFDSEENLFDFFARHFGKNFSEKFLTPLSFGIWGGASRKILIRHVFPTLLLAEEKHGSLIKYFLTKRKLKPRAKGLLSFPNGMHKLPQSLWEHVQKICKEKKISLKISLNTRVFHIEKKDLGLMVQYEKEAIVQEEYFSVVVCTTQPWRFPYIDFGPQSSHWHAKANQVLRKTPHHSLIVVGLGGPKIGLKTTQHGLGALENQTSQDLLGILFVHDIYQEHVPAGHFLFRCLFGGDRHDTEKLLQKSKDELIQLARKKLVALGLIFENAVLDFEVVTRWPHYVPLATTHQDELLKAVWQLEALEPGLFFAGNYLGGVGVADCLAQSQKTAQEVGKFLIVD